VVVIVGSRIDCGNFVCYDGYYVLGNAAHHGSRIMNIDTIKFRVKRLSYGLIRTQPLGMPRCYMYLGLMRFPCTVDELLWMHSHTGWTISVCR